MPDKKLFHNDAAGNEMTRPRGPDWSEDTRSWAVMDCRGEWVKCGDRYEVAATIHINDMKYYASLLEKLVERIMAAMNAKELSANEYRGADYGND